MELTPLWKLLENKNIVKVFHAVKQDLEIIFQHTGAIPAPIYDTQIAAMVCGFGEQIGYEALVTGLLNQTLDKASRFTEWDKRPLTARQIDYAIADVTHLRHIYTHLTDTIAKQGRTAWLNEEMAAIHDASIYETKPEDAWIRLKPKRSEPRYLLRLQNVAAWRETLAQEKDRPRGRIMKDDTLMQIALTNPADMAALLRIRGVGKHTSDKDLQSLLDAMAKANNTPDDALPKRPPRIRPLSPAQDAALDALKFLLKQCCAEHNVASKLVANKEILAALITEKNLDTHPCMRGWRYDIFGRHAQAFLRGETVLGIDQRTGQLTCLPAAKSPQE